MQLSVKCGFDLKNVFSKLKEIVKFGVNLPKLQENRVKSWKITVFSQTRVARALPNFHNRKATFSTERFVKFA